MCWVVKLNFQDVVHLALTLRQLKIVGFKHTESTNAQFVLQHQQWLILILSTVLAEIIIL